MNIVSVEPGRPNVVDETYTIEMEFHSNIGGALSNTTNTEIQ